MSEMISEMAAGFISVGKTLEERQNRLTALCCLEHGLRFARKPTAATRAVRGEIPAVQSRQLPDDLANIVKDMESLIERKLKMFPDDHRQIVSARVVMVGKDYRIEVASARLQ